MRCEEFSISGLKLVHPKQFKDERGFFTERFRTDIFRELGIPVVFVQDNFSKSNAKVLRGLHYQWDRPQGKLVTCLRGKIFDVAVDIRKSSPSFGRHQAVILDADLPSWLWIPAGFAHGFCVLGDEPADVMYKVDNYYNPKGEAGFLWNSPELKIEWPVDNPFLSAKDLQMENFSQYSLNPKF